MINAHMTLIADSVAYAPEVIIIYKVSLDLLKVLSHWQKLWDYHWMWRKT